MNDLIMMILGMTLFFILQFGVIGIVHFWNIYRYDLTWRSKDDDFREKTKSEVLSRVIRFKPKSGVSIKDKKGKFGRGFERRVWK